jgi:putative ABC transport system ATP-binding protein
MLARKWGGVEIAVSSAGAFAPEPGLTPPLRVDAGTTANADPGEGADGTQGVFPPPGTDAMDPVPETTAADWCEHWIDPLAVAFTASTEALPPDDGAPTAQIEFGDPGALDALGGAPDPVDETGPPGVAAALTIGSDSTTPATLSPADETIGVATLPAAPATPFTSPVTGASAVPITGSSAPRCESTLDEIPDTVFDTAAGAPATAPVTSAIAVPTAWPAVGAGEAVAAEVAGEVAAPVASSADARGEPNTKPRRRRPPATPAAASATRRGDQWNRDTSASMVFTPSRYPPDIDYSALYAPVYENGRSTVLSTFAADPHIVFVQTLQSYSVCTSSVSRSSCSSADHFACRGTTADAWTRDDFPQGRQSMSIPVLEARDIHKSYGSGASRFDALKGVSLSVGEGESVAIVGKSGSGKSTLMHLLALLDQPDGGSLMVSGKDAATLKDAEVNRLRNEDFGFVFQQFFLTPGTTVLDNVMLPLKIAGVPVRERKERAMAALAQLELTDKAKNKATALSGGQKQRVVIARALVGDPKVIFADEPTGNLDTSTGAIVEDILFSLNKNKGITLILVTHDHELAARCDRQIFLRDGLEESAMQLAEVQA